MESALRLGAGAICYTKQFFADGWSIVSGEVWGLNFLIFLNKKSLPKLVGIFCLDLLPPQAGRSKVRARLRSNCVGTPAGKPVFNVSAALVTNPC